MSDIFKDKTPMTSGSPATPDWMTAAPFPSPVGMPADTSVQVMTTPMQARAENGGYQRDAMDVRNLRRPRFGHNY